MSMANLDTFKKDTMAPGFCTSCNRERSRVSEQMHICESCLDRLQHEPQTKMPGTAHTMFKCRECKLAKSHSEIG
jgi:hypothetical protein